MVFATIGTQKQQFKRFFNILQNSKCLESDIVIAQSGNTNFETQKIKMIPFIGQEEFEKYMNEADFIICHGGAGTIFTALKKGKKIIAIPRLGKYNEHINDHQIEICNVLQEQGYLIYLKENDDIDEKIKLLKNKQFKKYEVNTNYLDKLRQVI